MGSARTTVGILFRRHDPQDLVYETRHVRTRLTSPFERDLHHQVVSDRSRHPKPQHEPHTGQRQLRLDRETLGRGARPVHPHPHQTHGARLQRRVLARRQVFGQRLFRQVRPHLVDADRTISAQLQGHRRDFRGLLELARLQSGRERFRWQCVCFRFKKIVNNGRTGRRESHLLHSTRNLSSWHSFDRTYI